MFFGSFVAAGTTCELDASSFGPGESLVVTQSTLAAPLKLGSDSVRLFFNGFAVCHLSQRTPNARLLLNIANTASFECVGPEGSGVHLGGYTYAQGGSMMAEPDEPEYEDTRTEADWEELQQGRKRRVAELQREAATEAKRSRGEQPPVRTPRLTFNPEVLVTEYVPKEIGISGPSTHASMDEMVVRREEIKQQQALEQASADEGGDGETLQGVLTELLSCTVEKLRVICRANGVDSSGDRAAMIERLIDSLAADMRSEREVQASAPPLR